MSSEQPMEVLAVLPGLPDWRVIVNQLSSRFATGDFNTGVEFISRIAIAADQADHHPDIALRYGHVDLDLLSHDVFALTDLDVSLALEISKIAAAMGLEAKPNVRSVVEIALDTDDVQQVKAFWKAVLKLEQHPRHDPELRDPSGMLPGLWFQQSEPHGLPKQRFHLDLWVARDEVQARIDAGLAAGGVVVSTNNAPEFTVLADAQGNKVCVCTVPDK